MWAHQAIAGVARHDLAAAVYKMLDGMRGMDAGAGLRAMLDSLVGQGHTAITLRIGRTNEMAALEPLAFPFEPQPLNEMHSALIREQTGDATRASGLAPGPAGWIRRNLVLKGSQVLLVIFGANWVLALVDAIEARTITWRLPVLSFALVALIFGPANPESSRQWFVVPGAIVLRKAGWLQRRWTMHLFERSSSVLCVSQWGRNLWRAHIADGQTDSSRALTKAEAEFLLRAWLSLLPPPALERMPDLQ
jgi:hypothetical protein